ncbi:complex I subunit 4 family protein [Hufsiella ginkgonis]|nr:NADH-quinone oxidoreductase subunit M [Hufsiella ginkgonis]
MELLLLILLPLTGAILMPFLGKSLVAKTVALVWSLLSLAVTARMVCCFNPDVITPQFGFDYWWIYPMGIKFKAGVDGISLLMVLLTNFLVPVIILATFKHTYKNAAAFYALILFMQSGMLVVFTALDAFLFYVGWEAALIPIYFICALWGGENRIRVNLKFFIYTMAGSLLMLIAIIYLAMQTPGKMYDIDAIYALDLDPQTQGWIFWAFFVAFAIKMPVFPFHTWQPDTYSSAPTAGTMLLSGIMLKMGVYGVIRWLIPVAPLGFAHWGQTAIVLSIIGIVYASLIAFTQKNSKRLIAYSSIAHVGLISAGIFAWNVQGLQGAMIQMLSHGINVIGLFFVCDIILDRLNTDKLEDLGGIAKNAPKFAIAFFVVLMGSVALPGTNGFIGEFLLLMGVYQYNLYAGIIAGLTIIFGAVYMLRMFQKMMLGVSNERTLVFKDISGSEYAVFVLIGILVIGIGVYPKPLMHLSEAAITNLVNVVNTKIQVVRF